jgi:hypothetical protein
MHQDNVIHKLEATASDILKQDLAFFPMQNVFNDPTHELAIYVDSSRLTGPKCRSSRTPKTGVRAKQSLMQKPQSAIAVIDAGRQDTANDDRMFIAKESEFQDATNHQPSSSRLW